MLKNKIIVKKIRNIFILLMAIIIMLGAYRNIRDSRAEGAELVTAVAIDNYKYLGNEEFELEAKSVKNNLYEIELPESINEKKVSQIYKVTLSEQEISEEQGTEGQEQEKQEVEEKNVEITDNKILLTKEEIQNKKIKIEVAYDVIIARKDEQDEYLKERLAEKTEEQIKLVEITETTQKLYKKIFKYEDEEKQKMVEVKGYLPLESEIRIKDVTEEQSEQIEKMLDDQEVQVAYDITIVVPIQKEDGTVEYQEIEPKDFEENCEVSISDIKISEESQVYHIKDNQSVTRVNTKEPQEIEVENKEENNEKTQLNNITFDTNEFSVYAVTKTVTKTSTSDIDTSEIPDLNVSTAATGSGSNISIAITKEKVANNVGYNFKVVGYNGTEYSRLQLATWTNANGQDDLDANWETATKYKATKNASGEWWFPQVNVSDHNNETGIYMNHAYGFDNNDNATFLDGYNVYMSSSVMSYEITNLTEKGFNVTLKGVGSDAQKVQLKYYATSGFGYLGNIYLTKSGSNWTGTVDLTSASFSGTIDLRAFVQIGDQTGFALGKNAIEIQQDTTVPQVSLGTNSNTKYAKTQSVTVNIKDTESGLAAGLNGNANSNGKRYIRYGWTTDKNTAPTSWTYPTISSYTTGTTSAISFTATGSDLTGKYYLYVDPYDGISDVAGNKTTADVVSTGQFYFDNTVPQVSLGTNSNTTNSKTHSVTVNIRDTDSGLASGLTGNANSSGKRYIRYGWTTDKRTVPTEWTYPTISSYTTGTTSAISFTAEGSGLNGKYYLYVDPYDGISDVAGNKTTTDVVSTGQFYFDSSAPTCTITANKTSPTNASSITYTFKFSESVTGFASSDITVSNGSKGSFSGSGDTYTLVVNKSSDGTQTVKVNSGVCTDAGGNNNEASNTVSIVIDTTAPTWASSVSNGSWSTSANTYTLDLVGSDATELDNSSTLSGKITVKVGGSTVGSSNLTIGSGSLSSDKKKKTFPLTIKNYTGSKIEITISAGALVDKAGNTSEAKTYTIKSDSTVPTWADNISDGNYTASASTYSLNLIGSDNVGINKSASTLSGNLTVKVGGSSVSTSNLTVGSSSLSSDGKTITFPLTIKNYTGGTISITISANALEDTSENKSSAKSYSFTPDTSAPTWASDVSNKSWSTSGKTYSLNLVGSDNTKLDSSSSTLNSSKVTVTVGNTTVSSSNLTFGSTTLSSDEKTKTFPLTIKNYTGGRITIKINAGALVDTSGLTSEEKTYTIITDSTVPTWASDISDGTYSASGKTYSLNLVGTDDKYLNASSSLSGKLTVKVKGTSVSTSNLTVGSGSLNADNTTITFPLTIKNYTGGEISITISAGALVDTSGNTSAQKTYTFTPDTTAPVWADNISNGIFSISAKTYKFNVSGSDETSLDTSASTLTKGSNISITVDGTSTSNYTIGTASVSGNTKTFPITLSNFSGGDVKVTISAGALKDTAKNESTQKIYEFSVDGIVPTWADNIIDGTYNADVKTYSLKFQGTDNQQLAETTLSSSNVTITADGTRLTNLSFGSVTTSADGKTKTFPLTINNFPGGTIKITISAGALKDTTGNESAEKTFDEFYIDGEVPTWESNISNGTYNKSSNTYTFDIKGTDNIGINDTLSTLNSGSSGNITIKVDGTNANFTLGSTTLNDKTKKFPITINNFYGGNVVVQISANALVDTSGNKSASKQYSFSVDATSPVWADDVSDGTYNSSTKKYSLNITGSDETALNDSASLLNTTNTTITIDGTTTTDWTIGTTTLTNGKTKKFPLTLNNFTGGTVKINISEGALKDTSNNLSGPKEYSFDGDVTPPQWQEGTGVYNPEDQSYTITVTGTDNKKLNNVSSELTTSNINLTVGGTKITPTITTTEATTTSETYTLTWQNHSGGEISLTINAGALVDTTGNTSVQKVYSFDAVDATKPTWNASISNAQYTLANDTDNFGTFTFNLIGTDNVSLDNAKSLLDGKMTITTDGDIVSSDDITIGTGTLSSDNKTKTFPITVRNFKGGDVVITISSGALVDTTGNKSISKTYSFFRDVTRPVWNENISDAIYNPTSKEYSFKLVGSDENSLNSTSSVLSSSNVTITVNGSNANLTFGSATLSGNTKTFPVVINNYTGGEIGITIQKGALVDTDGNVSLEKTYPAFTPDITAPVWTYEKISYNPDDISYSVELVGKDETELDTTLSALVTSGSGKNITVKCGNTTITPNITKISTSSTEVRYKLTINNFSGEAVTITINAGSLIDVSKNQSVLTEITLPEKDVIKPTLSTQNPEYSMADKTYTFDIIATDNKEVDNTTSALATSGSGQNVTITCGGGSIAAPTISIKEITITQIIYQVTINNYPTGVVNVSIDAGAIKDTTGNKSVATNFTLPALDIAKPYWEEQNPTVEYDETNKKLNIQLVGKDETSLNDTESTLALGSNMLIYIGGKLINQSYLEFGTTTISSDQLTKTFPLTINNYEGGIVEISLSTGALKDNSGKLSDSKTYTFTDVMRPTWSMDSKGSYDRTQNIYTLTLHGKDDTAIASANLTNKLTLLVDGDGDGTGTAVTPIVTLTSDGETEKIYTVAIPNYLGGRIELTIAEGALTDNEGNLSKQAYFETTPDITSPVWSVGNVEFETNSTDSDTILIDLYGTDNVYLTESTLVKNNITVQFGDIIVDRADIELTGPTSLDDNKGGVIYQLRVLGYTGEDITLIISADTLTDDSENKSVRTTITSEAIIPDSDDDVPTVSNVTHSVDALNGNVIIDFDIKDSWYNFSDLIETGEYTMSAKNYGGGYNMNRNNI